MPLISVVIPVYKAEGCLQELFHRLKSSLETISFDFEIIMVEDCGGDRSWDIIRELALQDKRLKGIQFSRNFGQHYGITAGLDHATGDWIVVMDCDLQDQPEEIPQLYRKAKEGFDVVLAKRSMRKDPFLKRMSSWIFYRMLNYLSGMHYDGRAGNFRIISKSVADSFRCFREQLRFFGGLVEWIGFPTTSIEVAHAPRFAGKSTYTFKKLRKLAIDTIIAFSDRPLKLAVQLGFMMSIISFLIGIAIIYRKIFYGSPVTGWASLIVSIYFIGGIIIGILGIIGVYLGKTFDETKKRPLYVIRRKTEHE